MSWLDSLLTGAEAAEPTMPSRKPTRPLVESAWFQTAAPSEGNVGAAEIVHWFVADGEVVLCDEAGKERGPRERLGAAGNAKAVAVRIGKRAWLKDAKASDFDRPLHYGPLGVA